MNSGRSPEDPGPVDDPKFKFLFGTSPGLMDPDDLALLNLWPEPARVHRALQLLCLSITEIWKKGGPFGGIQFGFTTSDRFEAEARPIDTRIYEVVFSTGLFERSVALFRKLSLVNAFGKYSQVTPLDAESLRHLLDIPGLRTLRKQESGPPIDSLLRAADTGKGTRQELLRFISQPPVDSKHHFDVQSLLIPGLLFAFWHEVGHVIHGHADWISQNGGTTGLSECAGLEGGLTPQGSLLKQRRALEYWADEFAGRRIALEILRSVYKETELYVLAPFWFKRENFDRFGGLEGLPGEKLEDNLEGFLYRIAFGISAFMLQFEGFFDPPHQDRLAVHPNAEVRLAHVLEAIAHQLNGGQDLVLLELSKKWQEQFGYALQTLEQCLLAHGASRTILAGRARPSFHLQEVRARVKKDGLEAMSLLGDMAPYRHRSISDVLEPTNGRALLPDKASAVMMGFDVR